MDLGYSFLMPPTILIAASLLLSVIALFRPQGVKWLVFVSALGLYLSSLPIVADAVLRWVAKPIPPAEGGRLADSQAIVVLGAGVQSGPNGEDILDSLSLERVALAARLYRELRLPVAVSGGRLTGARRSLGALMQDTLERDFSVPVRWSEQASHTTFENAEFTAALLAESGIHKVVLVTDWWHTSRAIWAFRHAGLAAIPYPQQRLRDRPFAITDILPSLKSLQETFYGLHELIGLAYYKLRY